MKLISYFLSAPVGNVTKDGLKTYFVVVFCSNMPSAFSNKLDKCRCFKGIL